MSPLRDLALALALSACARPAPPVPPAALPRTPEKAIAAGPAPAARVPALPRLVLQAYEVTPVRVPAGWEVSRAAWSPDLTTVALRRDRDLLGGYRRYELARKLFLDPEDAFAEVRWFGASTLVARVDAIGAALLSRASRPPSEGWMVIDGARELPFMPAGSWNLFAGSKDGATIVGIDRRSDEPWALFVLRDGRVAKRLLSPSLNPLTGDGPLTEDDVFLRADGAMIAARKTSTSLELIRTTEPSLPGVELDVGCTVGDVRFAPEGAALSVVCPGASTVIVFDTAGAPPRRVHALTLGADEAFAPKVNDDRRPFQKWRDGSSYAVRITSKEDVGREETILPFAGKRQPTARPRAAASAWKYSLQGMLGRFDVTFHGRGGWTTRMKLGGLGDLQDFEWLSEGLLGIHTGAGNRTLVIDPAKAKIVGVLPDQAPQALGGGKELAYMGATGELRGLAIPALTDRSLSPAARRLPLDRLELSRAAVRVSVAAADAKESSPAVPGWQRVLRAEGDARALEREGPWLAPERPATHHSPELGGEWYSSTYGDIQLDEETGRLDFQKRGGKKVTQLNGDGDSTRGQGLAVLALSPDGSRVALLSATALTVFELEHGTVLRRWPRAWGSMQQPVWSPDGQLLALLDTGAALVFHVARPEWIRVVAVDVGDGVPRLLAMDDAGRVEGDAEALKVVTYRLDDAGLRVAGIDVTERALGVRLSASDLAEKLLAGRAPEL